MPLVTAVQKAVRFPAYVDVPLPEPALRREHSMAKRHIPRFTRAFMKITRNLYTPAVLKSVGEAYRGVLKGEQTIEDAVNVVDWFNAADPLAVKLWEIYGETLENVYSEIVEDAGEGESRAQKWPLKFKVTKAADLRVPVNPFSIRWIRLKAAQQVVEVSDQQQALLRTILSDGFEQGTRPDSILDEIEQLVGLTERERGWVQSRRLLLVDKGFVGEPLEKAIKRYATKTLRNRAKRIARTETIDAYAQGLDDSWQLAKEEGFIDDTVMQNWVELTTSERTCKICRELGRLNPVPVGQPFVSSFVGEIERPPAHPSCRCVKVLVFVEDFDTSSAQANQDAIDARTTLAGV